MKKDFDPTALETEARERWGHTDAWAESARRTKGYDADTRARIAAELDGIEARFAQAMAAGHPPDSPAARALADEARLHIDRWYYPCSHVVHAHLAEMYTADPRFRAHYEDRAEGLAEYVAEAIRANLEAQGSTRPS